MLEIIKIYLLEYLNIKLQEANPEEAGIIARLIAYININL